MISRRDFLKAVGSAVVLGGVLGVFRWSGAQEGPVKVGVFVDQSKVLKPEGDRVLAALKLAFEQAGWAAGGRSIEIIVEDTTMSPAVGLDKVKKLIMSDRVDFLVGPISSAVAAAVRDTIHENKKVWFIANAGNILLTKGELCSPYAFRTAFNSWNMAYPMGPWVKEHVADRCFVIAHNYAWGQQQAQYFKEGFEAAGGEVVGTVLPPLPTRDFSPYLTEIAAANPPAVWSGIVGADAVTFVKQFAEFGMRKNIILMGSPFTFREDAIRAQGEAALGAFRITYWSKALDIPKNKEFIAAHEALFPGLEIIPNSLGGYDAGQAIVLALEETGGDTNPNRVIPVLEGLEFDSPRGKFRFDEQHEVVHNEYIEVVVTTDPSGTVVLENLGEIKTPNFACPLP